MRPKRQLHLAIPFMLIASLFGTLTGASAQYASSSLSVELMVFGRMLICLLSVVVWIEISRSVSWKSILKTREWKIHMVRGLCGLGGIFFYYYSLKSLYLTDATLLFNAMPIFVPFVAYFWRRIPIPHKIFWGIGTGFLGIIIVLDPGEGVFQLASLLALAASVFSAVATVALRFAHYTEPFERTMFYYFLVATIASGIAVVADPIANWESLDLKMTSWLLIIGLTGFAFQIFYTLASKYAPVRMISVFQYTSVIFSMIIDWLLWGREISIYTCAGFLLIVLGACLMVYFFPKENPVNR